jgi:hypothetical protein
MSDDSQLATNMSFLEELNQMKDVEIALGVSAPDPKLISSYCVAMIGLAVLCITFALFGNRAAANICLYSLWPLFGLLTIIQRSSRFKKRVLGKPGRH